MKRAQQKNITPQKIWATTLSMFMATSLLTGLSVVLSHAEKNVSAPQETIPFSSRFPMELERLRRADDDSTKGSTLKDEGKIDDEGGPGIQGMGR